MKTHELTQIIEESVKKAVRDELKSLLVELLVKNQNGLVENKQPMFNVNARQNQEVDKTQVSQFRQSMLSEFGNIGNVNVPPVNENASVANLFKDVAGRMKQEDFINFRKG